MERNGDSRALWVVIGAVLVAAILSAAACGDNKDVTAANQSLVQLTVDAPNTAKSGSSFGVQVRALNVGFAGIHEGHISLTLPAPLTVISVSPAPAGSSVTFSNGISGGTVQWSMSTLNSNSQVELEITTMGVLAPTDGTKRLTVVASMTAQGIMSGDVVAQDDVTLIQ